MPTPAPSSIGMGLYFYPRGGSAQVVRYLSSALAAIGCSVELASGSLGAFGEPTNAATFFGRGVIAADFTGARARFERGEDPMAAPMPFHPSFEDRDGVPDRVFAAVSSELAERQVDAWSDLLSGSPWEQVPMFHLHHLTPLHEAVERHWPARPRVTHLHGTELKFVQAVQGYEGSGHADGRWRYGSDWVERLRAAAVASAHLVCISPHDRELAVRLLGVDPDLVSVIPNGVDTGIFDRRELTLEQRLVLWRRWLVDEARGWAPGGEPGSVRYAPADLDVFVEGDQPAPVLLFVGRFLGFKRVPLLVEAYAQARESFTRRSPLVIWGGSPGEWEGEHPIETVGRLGVPDVFLAGWRGHDELALGLAASELMVAPSTAEPFGQVYLEAMSAGVPVVATASGGPLSFVNTEPTAPNGWLVEPDDVDALAAALVEAVEDPDERRRRADNAYGQIRTRYAWSSLAHRFAELYESL